MKHFPVRFYYNRVRTLGILMVVCMVAYFVMRLFFDVAH